MSMEASQRGSGHFIRALNERRREGKSAGPQGQRVLRREAGVVRRRSRDRPQPGDLADRPLGLRQVDVPALPQPHERHDFDSAVSPARSCSTIRTSTTAPSTWSSSAPASAWCSRSPIRSRSRSSRTSPTAPVSTASRAGQARARGDRRLIAAPRRPLRRGEGPPPRARHRPLRRPAAAPLHRPRHRRRRPKSS